MLLTPAENCCIIYSPILNSNINIQGQYSILLLTPAQKCRIIYFQYSRSIFNIQYLLLLTSSKNCSIIYLQYWPWISIFKINIHYSILLLTPVQNCRNIFLQYSRSIFNIAFETRSKLPYHLHAFNIKGQPQCKTRMKEKIYP